MVPVHMTILVAHITDGGRLTRDAYPRYVPLNTPGQSSTLSVAIPSRTAFCTNRPLEGIRVAVNDMFKINGLIMGLCNIALRSICPPSDSTAACVKTLIDAGATVVGTTKISSTLSGEEPVDAIDHTAPLNPRADG